MPTVIDSLVVTLGLDAKQFSEGQRQAVKYLQDLDGAAQKHGGNATRHVNELVGSFKELQGRLLAIGALIAAGLGFNRLTQEVTKAATELGNMSKQLGISAQELDAWEKVGRTVGASAGEMSQAISAVNSQLQEFKATGNSQLGALMGRDKASGGLGIGPMDAKNDTADTIMKRLSQWYMEQPDKAFASHLLQSRGGLSRGAIATLGLGPEELQRRLDKAREIAPTKEEIDKFTKLTTAFGELMNVIDRLTQQALTPFIGTLTQVLKLLTDWLTKWSTSNQNPADAAGAGLGRLGMPELDHPGQGFASRLWNGSKSWLGGGSFKEGFNKGSGGGDAAGGAKPSAPGSVTPGPSSSNVMGGPLSGGAMSVLDAIAHAEVNQPWKGGQRGGYGETVSGQHFDPSQYDSSHPYESGNFRYFQGRYGPSSASGRYQETLTTYRENVKKYGISGFSPEAQDRRAFAKASELYRKSGAWKNYPGATGDLDTDANRFGQDPSWWRGAATPALHREWTSVPGGLEPNDKTRNWVDYAVKGNELNMQWAKPKATGTPGLTGMGRTYEMWRGLGFGSGGTTNNNNNSNTSTTNVHSMNVTVPHGADPSAYADGIMRRFADFNNVQNSNTGLV